MWSGQPPATASRGRDEPERQPCGCLGVEDESDIRRGGNATQVGSGLRAYCCKLNGDEGGLPVIVVTDAAADKVKELLDQEGDPSLVE